MESSNYLMIIDKYDGAYGTTIRIDFNSTESLKIFYDFFKEMSDKNEVTKKVHEIGNIKIEGIDSFLFKNIKKDVEQKLEVNGKNIIWSNTSGGWLKCAGYIEGMIKLEKPCHQYLTVENVDDAIIEVSFLNG